MTETKQRKNRGHGEGAIQKRADGRWMAQLMVGYKADGARDIRSVYGKTRSECQKKLEDLRRRRDEGLLGDPGAGKETVEAFLLRWLSSIEGTMEPGSLRRHRDNVHRHLIPIIGRHRISALKPEHVDGMLAAVRTGETLKLAAAAMETKKGRGKRSLPEAPSARTVKYCFTTIRKALDKAVVWGAVPRNVARAVDRPQVPRTEIVALSPDEVATLLASASEAGDRLVPLYTVAIYSGCRKGELLGLTWDDVDLNAGRLSVKRTLVGVTKGRPDFGDPKTNRSRRTIRLSRDAVDALRVQGDRQDIERRALGESYDDHRLVFATPRGTPIDPDNVNKQLKAALKRAGLRESFTFHSLRHSAATMMLAAGISAKVVADRLGHFSAGFTLDRYVHAVEGLDADAADRLQAFVSRARTEAVRDAHA